MWGAGEVPCQHRPAGGAKAAAQRRCSAVEAAAAYRGGALQHGRQARHRLPTNNGPLWERPTRPRCPPAPDEGARQHALPLDARLPCCAAVLQLLLGEQLGAAGQLRGAAGLRTHGGDDGVVRVARRPDDAAQRPAGLPRPPRHPPFWGPATTGAPPPGRSRARALRQPRGARRRRPPPPSSAAAPPRSARGGGWSWTAAVLAGPAGQLLGRPRQAARRRGCPRPARAGARSA